MNVSRLNSKNTVKNLLFILLISVGLFSCAKKITNPEIRRLEGRETLLDETTQLNKLKLDLERELVKVNDLTRKVEDANDDASKSANEARKLSERVSSNPGDSKLANRADRASRRAAQDAKKARKLNNQLGDVNGEIKSLQRQIESKEKEMSELEKKIDYVPNQ